MREFEYLDWIRSRSPDAPGIVVGTGDDAAVVAVRDGMAAVEAAERLVAVAPDDPASFDALATAHAEAGNFDRAISAENRALQLIQARGQRDTARVREYMARLELFKSGRPFRRGAAPQD